MQVKESFISDGFKFSQIKRTKKTALFVKKRKGANGKPIIAYETFLINSMAVYPNDERFGFSAWCYKNLGEAERKFYILETG